MITPVQLVGSAFPELDFSGFYYTERVWADDGSRMAIKLVRGAHFSLGEDTPDSGWYCLEINLDGEVRWYKPIEGGRKPLAYFTASDIEAKTWVSEA